MYAGMPVVAFAVDALTESVKEGGYLIEPNNYSAFTEQIHAYYKLTQREQEKIQETSQAKDSKNPLQSLKQTKYKPRHLQESL